MKNIFFICMFGLLAFAGCSDNEEEILTGGNIDIDMLPPNQPNDVIDEKRTKRRAFRAGRGWISLWNAYDPLV